MATSHLEGHVPQVITAFIDSRMELVSALLSSGDGEIDDPLTDDEQLHEQLDTLPSLCRFQLQQVGACSTFCSHTHSSSCWGCLH